MTSPRVLLSGGGTGGHIFPAIAIAQEIQKRYPDAEFLFIGADNKMEMEKVPQAGFNIVGLNISGFNRGNLLSNFKLPFKVLSSLKKAKTIIKNFRPDVAIGTGGFASGPALWAAAKLNIPIFIQEQNAYPGITNKLLSKKAKAVFTAYPNMESNFPNTQVVLAGNPIRQSIVLGMIDNRAAKEQLGLDPDKLCILSVGGSLGSRTLNKAWTDHLTEISKEDFQLIWQTGQLDYQELNKNKNITALDGKIQLKEFVYDMPLAYSAADIIVSRAGAIAISELAVAGKPVLLVPFPFAAEDHQTKNALNLVQQNAAKMLRDTEMKDQFWTVLTDLISNKLLRIEMSKNIKAFAKPEATVDIVDEILKTINK